MNIRDMVKSGDFTTWSQVEQTDGSLIITLGKSGDRRKYRIHVKDLYGPNEEILEEEVIGE